MSTIILTAAGFYNPKMLELVKSKVLKLSNKSVAMVPTASANKENDKYAQLAKSQLLEAGYTKVDFIDLEVNTDPDVFRAYDTIYVGGGNTFKLLAAAKNANFKRAVTELLAREGLYIGVSAGSILMCPSVQIANEVQPDLNEIGMTDFGALNFVEETVCPHYEPEHEDEVKEFETKHDIVVTRLTNDQSVIFENGVRTLIN